MSDDTPEPDDLPAQEEKKTRRRKQDIARERRLAQVAYVLSSPMGRAFVWSEIAEGRAFQLSFAVGDSHLTAFNEGRRDRAIKLLVEIMADHPAAYALMAAEASDDPA